MRALSQNVKKSKGQKAGALTLVKILITAFRPSDTLAIRSSGFPERRLSGYPALRLGRCRSAIAKLGAGPQVSRYGASDS